MKFRKNSQNEIEAKDLLREVSRCKPEALEDLLKQIEMKIENSQAKENDLYMAKTMITSRMASMRSK
jgi:hypothetical protein